jgi:predicted kinase
MPKLILCRGIQASGKSTYSRQWVLKDPLKRVRFSNDDIRNMLGKYWVPSREVLVLSMRDEFLNEALLNHYDIIIDNMNLNPNETEYYISRVKIFNNAQEIEENKYEIEYVDFRTPLEECIARDAQREHPIGEEIIRNTYEKYKCPFYYGGRH